MKLGNDVLVALMGAFRKGISEGIDISKILREIDLVVGDNGNLKLSPDQPDIWAEKV